MTTPQQVLTLSFAGKRNHEGLQHIPAPLQELFTAFDAAFSNTCFRLVTGLANGADQAAAIVFSEDNWKAVNSINQSFMGAVMAFKKEDYLDEIDDKEKFEKLYALTTQKVHLDGLYIKDDAGESARNRAHRQQAKFLIRMADVFIAVAPLSDKGSAGGTVESVATALHNGRPVIFFNLDDQQFYYFSHIEEWIKQEGRRPLLAGEAVEKFKKEVCAVSTSRPPGTDEPVILVPENETLPETTFLKLRKKAWEFYISLFTKKNRPDSRVKEPEEGLQKIIHEKQLRLSEIAEYYQLQYRGGYMLNYMLALIAVLLAVTATVWYIFLVRQGSHHYLPIVILAILEAVIIRVIMQNTKGINKGHYNKKAIDYRYASERLRTNYFLSFAGLIKSLKPALGRHTKCRLEQYPGELLYDQVLLEMIKTPYEITLNSKKILEITNMIEKKWYQKQLRYHDDETIIWKRMHHILEMITERVSLIVFWIVVAEIVIKLGEMNADALPEWLGSALHFLDALGPFLLGITIFLPALVITLISITFQTEAKKLAERSANIKQEINLSLSMLKNARENIGENRMAEGSILMDLIFHLDSMSSVMTDEVAEWSILYEKRVYDS